MVYLELFLSFVKIGFTSFGGMSMVPLIMEEMTKHNWMLPEDLANIVGIAEMTPGPLGINCATFAGMRTAGVMGGIAAVGGVLVPAFTLTLLVAVFFNKFRENEIMEEIMRMVKPVCIAIIIDVMIELSMENYFEGSSIDGKAIGIGAVMFYLILKRKWSVPKVITSAAAAGILLYAVFPGMIG